MMAEVRTGFEALIFDCDGTLVDSEEIGLSVLATHARAIGTALPAGEAFAALRGRSMLSCLQLIEERLGRPLPLDFEDRVRASMAEAFRERLRPMPGAREVLMALRLPYCIATNGPRSRAELTLGVTGLLPYFRDRIFCAPEIGSFKPEPGLFLAAAAALRARPERCAVVEDSEPGMLAGLAAGMSVFAVKCDRPLSTELEGRVRMLGRLEDLLTASV